VQNAKYSGSEKNIFSSFLLQSGSGANTVNAGSPLFQAFSPIPVWGSTDSDCIKVGVKIDPRV